jgi:hypothetical protein
VNATGCAGLRQRYSRLRTLNTSRQSSRPRVVASVLDGGHAPHLKLHRFQDMCPHAKAGRSGVVLRRVQHAAQIVPTSRAVDEAVDVGALNLLRNGRFRQSPR